MSNPQAREHHSRFHLQATPNLFYFDRIVFALLAIHVAIFGWQIVTANDLAPDALDIIGADHSSVMRAMLTILEQGTLFDQTAAYHSSYYGWTYFFLSFLLLAPVKLVAWALNLDTAKAVYIGLKTLTVAYGALAIVTFYWLARLFFSASLSFLLAILLMTASPLTSYFYLFHPEPVGIIFLNLSLILLIEFVRRHENIGESAGPIYFIILALLVLSTLAKPTFFLMTFPAYLCLMATFLAAEKKGRSTQQALAQIPQLLFRSTFFALAIFFVVNPYFFWHLRRSINSQVENIGAHRSSMLALTDWQSTAEAWFYKIAGDPLLGYSCVSLILAAGYLIGSRHRGEFATKIYIFLCLSVIAAVIFIITQFRLFVTPHYFDPILPPLLISAMFTANMASREALHGSVARTTLIAVILALLAIPGVVGNTGSLLNYYHYADSDSYKAYQWINSNVASGSSIIHDHFVSKPRNDKIKDMHYWQIPEDELRKYPAAYIIFNPEFKVNGKTQDGTRILINRIETEPYIKIKTIGPIEIYRRGS